MKSLLEYLTRNHSQIFTRDQLLERIGDEHYSGDPKRLDGIINRLREKFEPDAGEPPAPAHDPRSRVPLRPLSLDP